MMRVFFVTVALLVLGGCANCREEAVVRYTRSGGYSGYADDLRILADFSYEFTDVVGGGGNGRLSAEEAATLKQLLGRYRKVSWKERYPSGSRFEDVMTQSLLLQGDGTKTRLTAEDRKTLLSLVMTLIERSYNAAMEVRDPLNKNLLNADLFSGSLDRMRCAAEYVRAAGCPVNALPPKASRADVEETTYKVALWLGKRTPQARQKLMAGYLAYASTHMPAPKSEGR